MKEKAPLTAAVAAGSSSSREAQHSFSRWFHTVSPGFPSFCPHKHTRRMFYRLSGQESAGCRRRKKERKTAAAGQVLQTREAPAGSQKKNSMTGQEGTGTATHSCFLGLLT